MKHIDLEKLVEKAREMAMLNVWGENAYKINMAILQMDKNNTAAYTRLAKYYKLNANMAEAKNAYLKALEIDPNNRGAINNLNDIEKDQRETDTVEQIKTAGELFRIGQSSLLKGKCTLAEKLFSKAYSIEPLIKYAVSLAGVYKKIGKHDSIERLYRQLIETNHLEADVEVINNEFKALGLSM